jgi:hypothetical protein
MKMLKKLMEAVDVESVDVEKGKRKDVRGNKRKKKKNRGRKWT